MVLLQQAKETGEYFSFLNLRTRLIVTRGDRFVLANTEELHEKIIQLQDRISSLENALGTLQAAHSSQPHPLLREDLLELKAPLGTELAPNHLKRRRTDEGEGAEP